MPPIKYPREPLRDNQGLRTRRIGPPATSSWTEPVFFEWELTGQSWCDEHPHAEYVYILEGRLIVESDGASVECLPGDMACVPPGAAGTYRAPDYARMISVYGPNPGGGKTRLVGLETLRSR